MIKLKPVKSSLKDTVIKAYNSAYIKAQNKNIDIILEILKDYQIVHDNKWTEEAIFNVIDNGIKSLEYIVKFLFIYPTTIILYIYFNEI